MIAIKRDDSARRIIPLDYSWMTRQAARRIERTGRASGAAISVGRE